jgi:hypothetical protein
VFEWRKVFVFVSARMTLMTRGPRHHFFVAGIQSGLAPFLVSHMHQKKISFDTFF